MKKPFYGIGTNSKGKYKAKRDGKMTKSYTTWKHMLQRVYSPKLHAVSPTYIGCSVSDEWLDYQMFAEWFEAHEYSNRGYHLDKDLLLPGNKIYAPNLCVFVPRELNNLLTDSGETRGQWLQGVCFHKRDRKFVAQMSINGKKKGLGNFDTEQEAYLAYKEAKEENVKRMANLWQDDIATNVYEALMQWELEGEK